MEKSYTRVVVGAMDSAARVIPVGWSAIRNLTSDSLVTRARSQADSEKCILIKSFPTTEQDYRMRPRYNLVYVSSPLRVVHVEG
jgi:hypothetical protein